jgi:hypothetical protein
MPFVHGLAKTEIGGRKGWVAPLELGEAAPHYISFAIPVDHNRSFFDTYICETIAMEDDRKRRETHELTKSGDDSFILRLGELEVWFSVRPVPRDERCLPYLGKLVHQDFRFLLTEIEPERPDILDRLFDDKKTFVVGCEPFKHYTGIATLGKTG